MFNPKIASAFVVDRPAKFQSEDIDAKVIVHFRPKDGWKGIGYGFDWMRMTDYPLIESNTQYNHGNTSYEAIVSKHYTTMEIGILQKMLNISRKLKRNLTAEEKAEITKNTSPDLVEDGVKYMLELEANKRGRVENFFPNKNLFNSLGIEYKFRSILAKPIKAEDGGGFEKYYCSWLALYPKQQAVLSLIVEVLDDKPYTLEFDVDNDYYTVKKLQEIDNLPKGTHVVKDAIEVTSNDEHSQDCKIEAYIQHQGQSVEPTAGVLLAWANNAAKHKKAKVIMVNIKTKEDNTIDLEDDDLEFSIKNQSIKLRKEANDFLKQMFIELDESLSIKLDLHDDKKFLARGDYYTPEGVLFQNKNNPYGDAVYTYFDKECQKEFNKKYPQLKKQYDNYLRIFFIDQLFYDYNYKTKTAKEGGHGSVEGKPYILFSSDVEGGYELAHEVAHSFGLMHSFTNKEAATNAKYTYTSIYTDNVMDYTQLAYKKTVDKYKCFSFWYWQWKIANPRVK